MVLTPAYTFSVFAIFGFEYILFIPSAISFMPSEVVRASPFVVKVDVGPYITFPSAVGATSMPFPFSVGNGKRTLEIFTLSETSNKQYSPLLYVVS